MLKDCLIRTRNLLEQGWTQFVFARDAEGDALRAMDDNAVAWCVDGALRKACGYGNNYVSTRKMLNELLFDKFPDIPHRITFWNDLHTTKKEDVLKLFDRAIATCGQHGYQTD